MLYLSVLSWERAMDGDLLADGANAEVWVMQIMAMKRRICLVEIIVVVVVVVFSSSSSSSSILFCFPLDAGLLLGLFLFPGNMGELLGVNLKSSEINPVSMQVKEHALHVSLTGTVVPRVWIQPSQVTVAIGNEDPCRCHCLSPEEGRVMESLLRVARDRCDFRGAVCNVIAQNKDPTIGSGLYRVPVGVQNKPTTVFSIQKSKGVPLRDVGVCDV